MLRRLPVLRTYAALRAKTAQLDSLTAEKQQLREQLVALRAKTTQLNTATEAELRQLREQVAETAALKRAIEKRDELLDAHRAPVMLRGALKRILTGDGQHYRDATPFPHIVIDEFLNPVIVRHVVEEFATMDRSGWHQTTTASERKLSLEAGSAFGPFIRRVVAELNAGKFVTFLEKVTGITGLIADSHLRGGGLHEIERGGLLGVHADFNYYKRLDLWRRLNLLIYLNTGWDESWGGHLEFWDLAGKTCVKRIAPVLNRAVIFETSNFSYHGHPQPLNCPEGHSRRSIALYYYTAGYPYADDRTPHSTVFIGPQQ